MEYKSRFTGEHIDNAIDKIDSIQPFEVRVIDCKDSSQWDNKEDEPTHEVLLDILSKDYKAISLEGLRVGKDEHDDPIYANILFIRSASINHGDFKMKSFYRFDEGDKEENEPPYVQYITIVNEWDDPEDIKFRDSQISIQGSTDVIPVGQYIMIDLYETSYSSDQMAKIEAQVMTVNSEEKNEYIKAKVTSVESYEPHDYNYLNDQVIKIDSDRYYDGGKVEDELIYNDSYLGYVKVRKYD